MKTEVPSRKRWLIVAAIFSITAVPAVMNYAVIRRSPNIAADTGIQDSSATPPDFSIADAYKQPPEKFSREKSQERLFGLVAPEHSLNGTGAGRRFYIAGMSPQDLDLIMAIRARSMSATMAVTQRVVREAQNRNHGREMVDAAMPTLGAVDTAQRQLAALDAYEADLLNLQESSLREIDKITKEGIRQIDSLVNDGRAIMIAPNTKLEVLDISDHYAKIRLLEPSFPQKPLFLEPKDILVR